MLKNLHHGKIYLQKNGITIIELLVVVAILAILAALLFPVFISVKYSSANVQCVNNLKQLGAAFSMYEHDWGGLWPNPGGLAGDYGYWSQSNPRGGLNPYIKHSGSRSVWCCPLMPNWKSYYPARTYTMNSYLRYIPDVEYPYSIQPDARLMRGISVYRIQQPGRTILLFEGLPLASGWEQNSEYVYIYRCCNWKGVKGYSDKIYLDTIEPGKPWHGNKNNYLYCDGHIVSRKPGRHVAAELSTYKEMYDWYVDKAYFNTIYKQNWSRVAPLE